MNSETKQREEERAFIVALVACTCIFIVFVGFWIGLNKRIRESADFKSAVPQLIKKGQFVEAIKMSQLAAERNPIDLEAANLYAKALMASGENEKALRQYDRLFKIREHANPDYSNGNSTGIKPTILTQQPYFFAEARLENAKYLLRQSKSPEAVQNIELAKAFGQEISENYDNLLFDAYSQCNEWGLAYDHYDFKSENLKNLTSDSITSFMISAAYNNEWHQCKLLANALLEKEEHNAEANYWLGRSLLAMNKPDDALKVLKMATESGQQDAPFFLGIAMERSSKTDGLVDVFLSVPEDNIYHPFALAKIIMILETSLRQSTEVERDSIDEKLRKIKDECRNYFTDQTELPPPFMPERTVMIPLGFDLKFYVRNSSTPVLARTLWQNPDTPTENNSATFSIKITETGQLLIWHGSFCLDIRMLKNLVPFGTFHNIKGGSSDIPGWPELYRKTPRRKSDWNISVLNETDDSLLRIECNDGDFMTGLRSVMIPANPDSHYLFATRCKSEGARLFTGWDWYDSGENVVYNHNIFNQVMVSGMTWETEYLKCPFNVSWLQALAGVYHDVGSAQFDVILIFEIDPPTPET